METDPMIEFVTARMEERATGAQGWLNLDATSPGAATMKDVAERILAELEATRRIIANARTALDQAWQLGEEAREATAFLAVRTLQHLAELDADHPDYDPAWQL